MRTPELVIVRHSPERWIVVRIRPSEKAPLVWFDGSRVFGPAILEACELFVCRDPSNTEPKGGAA